MPILTLIVILILPLILHSKFLFFIVNSLSHLSNWIVSFIGSISSFSYLSVNFLPRITISVCQNYLLYTSQKLCEGRYHPFPHFKEAEGLNNLFMVTQLPTGRTRIQIQALWPQCYGMNTRVILSYSRITLIWMSLLALIIRDITPP